MNQVNITDRATLRDFLSKLKPETKPLWGRMKPQQMVEHLVKQVEYTNGKRRATCDFPPDIACARKQHAIHSNEAIPKNIDLGEEIGGFRYPDLTAAIGKLLSELDSFDSYFTPAGTVAIHGGFGPMNHEEWLWWHGKHFAHHFAQFGLFAENA